MSKGLTIISSLVILAIAAGSVLFWGPVLAAPPDTIKRAPALQDSLTNYMSLSALAFTPINRSAIYDKDLPQQLLTLDGHTGNFGNGDNLFVLGLTLPDQTRLTGLTIFGQDFDNRGEVRLRLNRCEHTQPACFNLAEVTSDLNFNAGSFAKESALNEYIDNNRYTYFLELEMTALTNSGLRSVRLDLVNNDGTVVQPTSNPALKWELAGAVTSLSLITGNARRTISLCTDDLSHLPNPTHYPMVVVDGVSQILPSKTCMEATGYTIELRRQLNTGPSSGTYQILR